MKHVAKPTSNIKLMLMSRGDSSKKKKKEVRSRGLCHVFEFTVYCLLQTSASLKDDPVLANILKEIRASGEVGESGGSGGKWGEWGEWGESGGSGEGGREVGNRGREALIFLKHL